MPRRCTVLLTLFASCLACNRAPTGEGGNGTGEGTEAGESVEADEGADTGASESETDVGDGDGDDFDVNCVEGRQWDEPHPLMMGTPAPLTGGLSASAGAGGEAMALWRRDPLTFSFDYSQHDAETGSWSESAGLGNGVHIEGFTAVRHNQLGDTFLLLSDNSTGPAVYRYSQANQSWSQHLLSPLGHDVDYEWTLEVDREGNATLLALEELDDTQSLRAVSLAAGAQDWATSTLLAEDVAHETPAVAIDGHGRTLAMWATPAGNEGAVYFAERAGFDEAWGEAQMLPGSDITSVGQPVVATDLQGNAFALFRAGAPGSDIFAVHRLMGESAWSEPVRVYEASLDETLARVQLVALEGGEALALWTSGHQSSTANAIMAAYFDGSGWGEAQTLVDDLVSYSWVQLRADACGNAWAAYYARPVSGNDIVVDRFDPATAWSGPQVVAETLTDMVAFSFAVSEAGHATLVYGDVGTQGESNVFVRRFE